MTRMEWSPPRTLRPSTTEWTWTVSSRVAGHIEIAGGGGGGKIGKRKEGNVLFNDALNTFYLRLYSVRHMVKDHSDSERGNLLLPRGLLFLRLATRVHLYSSSHRQDNTYHGLYNTSRGSHDGTRNRSMGPP